MPKEGFAVKNKKERTDAHHLNEILFNERTQVKNVEEGDGNNADKLRMESYNNLSPNMKEALSQIGTIFATATRPWAIHGSTALVLEAETSKKPLDIDIAFADVDKEAIFANFKKLESEGKARNLEPKEVEDLDGKKTGCVRISADVRTGAGTEADPYVWIETEAYAQNIDPAKEKNGYSNVGLDPMTLMKYKMNYKGEGNVDLYFADREENFKFYLQIAAIELQKYQLDNSFIRGLKNKFPQRLNNILAIIKRTEREKFEENLKSGAVTEEDRPNIEVITDENIKELVKEFRKHNAETSSFTSFSKAGSAPLDPVDVLFAKSMEFQVLKGQKKGQSEGFIRQNGDVREKVLDELTTDSLADMTGIGDAYQELKKLQLDYEALVLSCKMECNDEMKQKILEDKTLILSKTEVAQKNIEAINEKYVKYLDIINYTDNRDFIAYIAIKETIDSYILPSMEMARNLRNEVESISYQENKIAA